MKQTFKRFLSAALALAMVFTMLPHMVHAEPESTDLLNLNFEDGNTGDLTVNSNGATEGYSVDVAPVSGNKVLAVHADPGIKLNLTYALPEAMSSATLTYYIASVGQGNADFPCFYTSGNINASMPKFGLLNGAGIKGYTTANNQTVAGAAGETISHYNYQWHAVKVVFNAGVTKLYIDGILTNVNNQFSTNTTANRIGMVVSSHATQISNYYIDNIRVTAGAGENNTGSHEPAAAPNPIDLVNLNFNGEEEGTVPAGIAVNTTGGAVAVKNYANNKVLSVSTNVAGKTTQLYYALPAAQTQVTLTYHINQVSEGTAYFPTLGYTSPNYNVQFGVHDTSMAYKTAWAGAWNALSPQGSGSITHSCNQWHAVKVVIDTVAKTTKVFIDGVLTNVEYSTAVDTRAVTNVYMYVFEDIGEFYIDNLRVTQGVGADGNGSHEPAATPDREVLDWTQDFEDETVDARPSDILTSLDETVTTYSLKVEEVAGNKVLSVGTQVGAASNVYLQWWYALPASYNEVTLTYNIAQRVSHQSNFLTVGNSNGFLTPTVRFGTGTTNLVYYDGTSSTPNALAAANAGESISHALNKWHTVKVVYAKSGVCKVFIDGILTNVATNKTETISRIGMYLAGKNGDAFYIDNIRVTEGIGDDSNGSHEPTVPTACLCQSPIWANGICSVCNAHCDHDWADADCDTPKTCNVCGAIEGEALGHYYDENGKCQRDGCTHQCLHEEFTVQDERHVCTVCGHVCQHENWTPANCSNPKTCTVCKKTEGEKGGDHVLGDDNVCDVCGFAYLADFDFEDGILPGVASTHDGGSSYVQVAEVNGNKVLALYRANGEGPVYWHYYLGGSYDNVTLTYNVAFTAAVPRSTFFPTVDDEFSTEIADYALPFGAYSANNLQYYKGGWKTMTTTEVTSMPATANRWFTVKIVYSNDGDNTNDIVYIDGVPTNAAVNSYVDISEISILFGTYLNQFPNTIYVDNICVSTNGDHEPAVPSCFAEHTYDKEIATDKYKVNDATCTAAATYYYSCVCGATGTDTFTVGEALGHSWEDGVCTRCDLPCEHIWENSVCTICEKECAHENATPADCDSPWTCLTCGKTEGDVSHDWAEADCDTPKTCNVCHITEGDALGHDYDENGHCQRENCGYQCPHEGFTDDVCDVCGYVCLHETWTPANCSNPKTCPLCGKTEGEKGGDHVLGDDNQCDECGITFLADFDFEDGILPGVASPNDGSNMYVQIEELNGNKVLVLYRAKNQGPAYWYYDLGGTYDNVTLTYNIAMSSSVIRYAIFPTTAASFTNDINNSNVLFGQNGATYIQYNKSTWTTLTTTESSSIAAASNQWYTVKIVFSNDGDSTNDAVYINGLKTNVEPKRNNNPGVITILMPLNASFDLKFYVDNICLTTGGDHEEPVPGACLCQTPSWENGVCTVCQAHCKHSWVEADCDEAKHCTNCGMTEGEALGHDYHNGFCTVCDDPCTHNWLDSVCTICDLVCEHENWAPANCTNPKTCELCGKEEGGTNLHRHNLGDDLTCDDCGTVFLAYLDFEGENPETGTLPDEVADVSFAKVENGLLHIAAIQNATSYLTWNYSITSSAKVTLSYNIAATGSSLISNFPVLSSGSSPSPIQFGLRSGALQWNSGSWGRVTVGPEGNETNIGWNTGTPCWHTVKMVYDYNNGEYTVELYVDDVLTNCTQIATTNPFRAATYIVAQIQKNYQGHIYIDNVRATAGDFDHLPAVPTTPLCPDNSCVVGDDGVCEKCHAVFTYTVDSVNAVLGDNLDMNFFIETNTEMDTCDDTYFAKIVHTKADGSEPIEVMIPRSEWDYHEGYQQYFVTYHGIAAKEMGDTLTVTICDSEGNAISPVYTDSFKDYIGRLRENNASDEYLVKLCDDLLIYGAAAQKGFGYNSGNLVSESRPATPTVNNISSGNRDYWNGTSLKLESNILLKVFYKSSAIQERYSYQVTYTDHYGNNKTLTGTVFGQDEGDSDWYVPVTGLSLADYQTAVTVKILNAEGQVLDTHTVVDSIESFVARSGLTYDIYRAIIQVGTSAFNYFHKDSQTT